MLEHRYFGQSQPFDDLSTYNLRFLTVEQATADISNFIKAMNLQLGKEPEWIVVGSGYQGTIASLARAHYAE
jgi:hypothetical protein